MPSIRCGSCKGTHESVAAVRDCYAEQADARAESAGEQAAELRNEQRLENTGWEESANDRAHEDALGVVQFEDAMAMAESSVLLATAKQVNFIMALEKTKVPADERHSEETLLMMERPAASEYIERLIKAAPVANTERESSPTTAYTVPAGRYAVKGGTPVREWKFYKVDHPTEGRWAGYTFVNRQAGDDLFPVKGFARNAVLAAIEHDGVQESMLAYGKQLGACGHCGRTLTNPESIERGIGPVCFTKMGW